MSRLVFCDIEGTLIDGSMSGSFLRAGRALRLFPRRRLALAGAYALLGRALPRYAADLRWRALLQLLAGQRLEAVQEAGRAATPSLRALLKPAILGRLAAHQAQGDTVVLISGGLDVAAQMIAAVVGAAGGEGTGPEVRDGAYTGRLRMAINHGAAKARRAAALARASGVALRDCVAYGDSRADIPLLAAVGHPVAVDPDAGLRRVAEARGWEILTTKPRAAGREPAALTDQGAPTMKMLQLPLTARLARPVAETGLLAEAMPEYAVASRHSLVVRAPAATLWTALRHSAPGAPPVVRVLFALRALPGRLLRRGAAAQRAPAPRAPGVPPGFVLLAEQPGRELVVGTAGAFWRPTGNLAPLADAAAWQTYAVPGAARAALTFRVEPIDYQTSRLHTETRVQPADRAAALRFRVYWTLIAPFSGLIRRALLRQIRRAAEQATGLFLISP